MNLTQIIVYKHQDQQTFVCCFNTKAQCAHTCVAVLTPDSLTVKYFMTLCMFRYPDVLVKDTLEMDILVTDISVKGHFGKRTFR